MSCNCTLHLAHDHVGMTVVGVFMVMSLDVTSHVPPQHCVYSTASYFVFDNKLDKHTQVFSPIVAHPPLCRLWVHPQKYFVLRTFAQLNTQHFFSACGVRSGASTPPTHIPTESHPTSANNYNLIEQPVNGKVSENVRDWSNRCRRSEFVVNKTVAVDRANMENMSQAHVVWVIS